MTRRRYVVRGSELVEVPIDWTPAPRVQLMTGNVYEGKVAPDGTPIGSRRKTESYMREHGLVMATDYKNTWAQAAKEREQKAIGQHEPTNRARREVIARTIHHLENRSRR